MPPSEIRKEARESLTGKWGKAVRIILAYFIISFAMVFIKRIAEECSSVTALVLELAYFIISVPMSFGLIISFIKLKRDEEVSDFGFLKDGFSRFGKSWGIWAHILLKLLLPILCLIFVIIVMVYLIVAGALFGIVGLSIGAKILFVVLYLATLIYIVSRSFLYVLAYYIGYDEPDLSSKECVKKSEELMKGNRGNYFLLQLSFMGWAILTVVLPLAISSAISYVLSVGIGWLIVSVLLTVLSLGIGVLWLMPYISVAEVCFYERIVNSGTRKINE